MQIHQMWVFTHLPQIDFCNWHMSEDGGEFIMGTNEHINSRIVELFAVERWCIRDTHDPLCHDQLANSPACSGPRGVTAKRFEFCPLNKSILAASLGPQTIGTGGVRYRLRSQFVHRTDSEV